MDGNSIVDKIFTQIFFSYFVKIHMSLYTFSQSTFTGKLIQGQGHDGSVFVEVSSNLTGGLFSNRKPMNINVSRSAAPNLTLVPASRYNCDVSKSYVNICAKFIRIKRGSDGIISLILCFSVELKHQ